MLFISPQSYKVANVETGLFFATCSSLVIIRHHVCYLPMIYYLLCNKN
ncbi:hypothetical protein HanRHA438_Chr04g0156711 [Helianthus annuus]|nr:hypothetical protein HanRHA438_Chr04g0156711 [Helianthus annuus]